MKTILALLACFPLLLGAAAASEAVDAELFPAEFLYQQRAALGIADAQLQAIGGIMRKAQPLFVEGKRQLEEAAAALQKILHAEPPDGSQAEEKLHVVLDCEGEIKMLQLRTLLAVRAQLSAEQIGKARQLRDQLMAKAKNETSQRERVNKKLEQLREAIKAQAARGEVPPAIIARTKGIYDLFSAGKDAEAEKQIDDFLSQLGEGKAKP